MASYTKRQAAARLGVSDSTVDRRVSDGTPETEKEHHGRTNRIWVCWMMTRLTKWLMRRLTA